jgi:hypothetical protein
MHGVPGHHFLEEERREQQVSCLRPGATEAYHESRPKVKMEGPVTINGEETS